MANGSIQIYIGGAGGPAGRCRPDRAGRERRGARPPDGRRGRLCRSRRPARPRRPRTVWTKANSAVRPYAIYSVEAVLDGWQTVVLNGVQVFDGQQTVARLSLCLTAASPAPHGQRAARRILMSSPSRPTRCLPGTAAAARHRRNSYPATSWRVVVPKKSRCIWGNHPPTSEMLRSVFSPTSPTSRPVEVYPTWDSVPATQCGITRPLKAPDYFYRALVVFWRTDDNRLYQGVHQGIGQRLGCIGLQFGLHQLF